MKRIFGPYPPSPKAAHPAPPQPENLPQQESPEPTPAAAAAPRVRTMGALRMATRAHQERLARIQAAQANYREQQEHKNEPS